jgi:beta-lactamase class A
VISRRMLLPLPLLVVPPLMSRRAAAADDRRQALRDGIAALERRHGGRLGVAVQGSAGQAPVAHRGHERFALCSTHKFLSAAFVLARVDRDAESLSRRVVYPREALVPYSPITEQHAGAGGLTIGEICEAALTLSDNTAANLLLDSFGGPPALTAWLRTLGDGATRLDRREPALNEASPGDPRDTTTPLAMLHTLRQAVLGTVLSPASRTQLADWLVACKTGDKRLRAGVPGDWRAGDKTGSGGHNATNDIAVFWPPAASLEHRAPILVTAYYAESRASAEERDAVLSEVGRLAAGLQGRGGR